MQRSRKVNHLTHEGRFMKSNSAKENDINESRTRNGFLGSKGRCPWLMTDDAHQWHPMEREALISRISTKNTLKKLQGMVLLAEPSIRGQFNNVCKWRTPGTAIDNRIKMPY